MIFLDANVMIDIIGTDQAWQAWSRGVLRRRTVDGEDFVINAVVLAEIAGNAPDLDRLLSLLADLDIEILTLDVRSAFAAGQAYRLHRRRQRDGLDRRAKLADFLIGAHALFSGAMLMTRDAVLYRRYFPDLQLVTPETHP